MKISRLSRPLALAPFALACVVLALAPPAAAEEPASARERAEERATARADVDGTLGTMSRTALRVRDMLRDTRRNGTKAQIACLDESLSRADVALRRARESGARSLAGYDRGDVELARAERRRVLEWREAQRLAARDASVCVPNPLGGAGLGAKRTATRVTLSVDPTLPHVD